MLIDFSNPKHERLANDFAALENKYGNIIASAIDDTLKILLAADSLFDIPRSFRPHPLKGVYKGFFAVDVTDTHRIIFKPNSDCHPNYRIDNPKTITGIFILEIYKDYH